MNKNWINLVPKIIDNLGSIQELVCPHCGEHGVDYLYIGDEISRVGYMQIWCNKCLKGIYISRAVAPANAKFVSFEEDLKEIVPNYEFLDD